MNWLFYKDAHFGMRIYEGAQLLSGSHVVNQISTPLIF